MRHTLQQVLDALLRGVLLELLLDAAHQAPGQPRRTTVRLDVQAIAERRRDAPRRRVRLVQQAPLLEAVQHVADRRARGAKLDLGLQRAGADRTGVADEELDEGFEDGVFTFAELHESPTWASHRF